MAACDVDELKSLIREIGAPPRPRTSRRCRQSSHDFGGVVPDNFRDLESLRYWAKRSVVMAQALMCPHFPSIQHSSIGSAMGLPMGRTSIRQSRIRGFSEELEQAPSSDHLLRKRILSCAISWLTTCPICSWASTKKRQQAEARMNRAKKKR